MTGAPLAVLECSRVDVLVLVRASFGEFVGGRTDVRTSGIVGRVGGGGIETVVGDVRDLRDISLGFRGKHLELHTP